MSRIEDDFNRALSIVDANKSFEKKPFAWSLEAVALLANVIEEKPENLDEHLIQILGDARVDLAEGVDMRISLFRFLKKAADAAAEEEERWAKRSKALIAAKKRAETITKETIEAVKVGGKNVPVNGTYEKICVQNNADTALEVEFPLGRLGVSSVLTPHYIQRYQIDKRFIDKITVHRLDTALLKKALESGAEIPWAKLKLGNHIRVRPIV